MNVESKVINLIATQAGLRSDEPVLKTYNLRDDLNLDSLELVELWFEAERVFDIEIPQERLQELVDVQGTIDVVNSIVSYCCPTKLF